MEITFYKYQGTGNDFILFDNRNRHFTLTEAEVKNSCDRKFGIGADGLILLQNKEGYDFEMIYYNADGGISTMCGNGGRCIVKFAYNIGICKEQYQFLAVDGVHEASIVDNIIKLKMQNVHAIEKINNDFILNTGSPHFISFESDVKNINVKEEGSAIRYNDRFSQYGVNVNFVEIINSNTLFVRTYERGVEDETLSCGTGVTAAALVIPNSKIGKNQIQVNTLGGNLSVTYNKINENQFEDIYLCGPATFVFKGGINR